MLWDIGGVLLDWEPRRLLRKLFADVSEMEWFLSEVCTSQWHAAHDRGVPFEASGAALAAEHPRYTEAIMAWGRRSEEMEGGEFAGSVELLAELKARAVPCFALTNMERETYPRRVARYPFMSWFDGIVVSSHEGIVKPDAQLYEIALRRFRLQASSTLAIDDQERNLLTAVRLGFQTLHFRDPAQCRTALEELALL